jgi:hypothetical protein
MSHDEHGHDEHGHDDHGHDAHAPDVAPVPHPRGEAPPPSADHGHHDPFPPAPSPRTISPARADYATLHASPGMAWPLVWLLVALLLFGAADRSKGEVKHHEHGGAHGEPSAPAGEHAPEHGG